MFRTLRITVVLILAATSAVAAACPAVVTGTTAEAIDANSRRLLCLQQELANETAYRKYEFDLKALQQQLRGVQLQQHLDRVAPVIAPLPVFP